MSSSSPVVVAKNSSAVLLSQSQCSEDDCNLINFLLPLRTTDCKFLLWRVGNNHYTLEEFHLPSATEAAFPPPCMTSASLSSSTGCPLFFYHTDGKEPFQAKESRGKHPPSLQPFPPLAVRSHSALPAPPRYSKGLELIPRNSYYSGKCHSKLLIFLGGVWL